MSAQHTPGPWTLSQYSRVSVHVGDWIIAMPYTDEREGPVLPLEQQEANALLITAAPDLLRALRLLLKRTDCDYYPVEQGMARAAIAKATGSP